MDLSRRKEGFKYNTANARKKSIYSCTEVQRRWTGKMEARNRIKEGFTAAKSSHPIRQFTMT